MAAETIAFIAIVIIAVSSVSALMISEFRRNRRMQVICAWCNRIMIAGNPLRPASHGMCKACKSLIDKEE